MAFGADSAERLVQGDVEADIAVTDSIAIALRAVKETENTTIVITYFRRGEGEMAEALATHYPERMTAVPEVGREGETEIVPFLLKIITDKTKES